MAQWAGSPDRPIERLTDAQQGNRRCRPWGDGQLCPHRRPVWCAAVHGEDDDRIDTPLCGDCYDYVGHFPFNWYAPELWRRFTITLRRALARQVGLSVGELARRARALDNLLTAAISDSTDGSGLARLGRGVRRGGSHSGCPPRVGVAQLWRASRRAP